MDQTKLLAQTNLGSIGGEGLGPFGNFGQLSGQSGAVEALSGITKVVSVVIGVMTIAAAIWFIFQFLTGGISWISSAGDKAKLETARNRITHAFVGLIIVVAGWAILALAGQFFGYNILIDPSEVINQLGL